MVLVSILKSGDLHEVAFWRLLSWTAMLVWLRFAQWMRSSSTLSWMLTLIMESVSTMLQFMLVLICGIFAFADAFRAIERVLMIQGKVEARVTSPDMSVFDTYLSEPFGAWQKSFLVAVGEFHDELEHYSEFDWCIFFFAAFFNLILMLNLLISIISETYTNVSEQRLQTSFKERAMLIDQRNKSFLGFIGRRVFDSTDCVFLAKTLDASDSVEDDDETTLIISEIENLHGKIDEVESRVTHHVDDRLFKLAIALVEKLRTSQPANMLAPELNSMPAPMTDDVLDGEQTHKSVEDSASEMSDSGAQPSMRMQAKSRRD